MPGIILITNHVNMVCQSIARHLSTGEELPGASAGSALGCSSRRARLVGSQTALSGCQLFLPGGHTPATCCLIAPPPPPFLCIPCRAHQSPMADQLDVAKGALPNGLNTQPGQLGQSNNNRRG